MIVVTIDQVGSSTSTDRVPDLLDRIGQQLEPDALVLPFERTTGDEVQGLLASVVGMRRVVSVALRDGGWSIGVGIGDVLEPLPASTREASGTAYVLARRAVERAKNRRAVSRVAVEGVDAEAAAELEAAWHLIATIAAQRSEKMWEAIDTVAAMDTQAAAAAELGISVQALSQRLQRSGWPAELAAHPLLDSLAERAS